ncbi:hypothetical protein, partial [Pseudomonas syringae group genomosp. 7]|uniref:hypothetical protein n=1 Tax=Pseudomonas syringae group genomosp. 7 TaxID=251699 RepID=UPI0037702449
FVGCFWGGGWVLVLVCWCVVCCLCFLWGLVGVGGWLGVYFGFWGWGFVSDSLCCVVLLCSVLVGCARWA